MAEQQVFTFEHRDNVERRSAIALNEEAARRSLGGDWCNSDKTKLLYDCRAAALPALIERTLKEEHAAYEVMLAANPIGKESKITTANSLKEFSVTRDRYKQLSEYRKQLEELAARLIH